jgi:hypothetical protein
MKHSIRQPFRKKQLATGHKMALTGNIQVGNHVGCWGVDMQNMDGSPTKTSGVNGEISQV